MFRSSFVFYASFHTSKKRHFLSIKKPNHMEVRRTSLIVSLLVSDLTRVRICRHILVKASKRISVLCNSRCSTWTDMDGRTDGDTLLKTQQLHFALKMRLSKWRYSKIYPASASFNSPNSFSEACTLFCVNTFKFSRIYNH